MEATSANKLEQLRVRLETDGEFRQEFEADPEGVLLRETGMSEAELQERAERLDDSELAGVSGGVTPELEWFFAFYRLYKEIKGLKRD